MFYRKRLYFKNASSLRLSQLSLAKSILSFSFFRMLRVFSEAFLFLIRFSMPSSGCLLSGV